MHHWESHVDRLIREAMERGDFANLPGKGKPLPLDDDPFTPENLRLAYAILKDNGLAPEWIMAGRDLLNRQEQLLGALKKAAVTYQTRSADQSPQVVAVWDRTQRRLREEADRLNREITVYNLKLPADVPHRPTLNFQVEVDRALAGE